MRWWRRRESEHELERELRSHLELEADEQQEAGMSPRQASYAARRAFGNTTLVQEEIREMSRWILLDRLRQDLHYAFRALGRNRGFTTVAILTLALGIGANTAIFSLLNAVELRRLPVRDPQQLVMLEWAANKKVGWPEGYNSYGGCDSGELGDAGQMRSASAGCSFSYPVFDYFRLHSKLFSGLAAVAGPSGFQARIHGEIVRANAQFVSGDFFSVLGVSTQLGRTLDTEDDRASADPVAVLSSRYWEANFGSDPHIVGKTIVLDGAPFTVIGVSAKEFFGVQPAGIPDLWIPVHSGARLGFGFWHSLAPGNGWLYIIGRLNSGVSSSQARAEVSVLLRQAPGSVEVFTPEIQTVMQLAGIARGLSGLRRLYSDQLHVLMAVVGLVLLIACANIANLLLTRASVRRREMAVRMAIGCSRGRLLQQLLTESLLLSALGTAAGLILAQWAGHAIAARTGSSMLIDVRLDPLVLSFTVCVACLAAALFGLAPALAGTREQPVAALRSGTASGQRNWFGRTLVAAEMALALVLLIGAGLFVRTLLNLEKLDPGFRRDNLLTLQTMRPRDVNNPQAQSPDSSAGLRDRLAALPGVLSATWASEVLLIGNREATTVRLAGRDDLGDVQVDSLRVGPRFFETMGIPVLAGRSVQIQDCQPDVTAIWINRRLAEKYGSNVDLVGKAMVRGKTRYAIAGIVGDTKYETLRSSIDPSIYIPSRGGGIFVLRTASDPESLATAARAAVHEANPNLLVANVKSEAAQIDEQLLNEHVMARLSSVFGLLALTMAAIGIYGVLAFSVTRRTAEIAIRMSLGAMPGEILRLVLRDGLAPAAIGAAVGLLASWGLTKLIATLLFGVTALDPFTYLAATFLLLAVAILACYIPARRATRVSPVVALRYE
jgi:macrolide transport system ATP-binding/permease protein